ncbi:unnamed protein product [Gemmata massiliana]|uniref:Repeat-companion domain protein n=1 Tax=Gemmata massiliana TaxID=1210884 RepID=A0A6P2DQY4_9BACT|nr:TIGR02996 domain-containing protein [Gemmata massiliana]VTS03906.1 unnamed protein product [Gemmata massiliana]
MSSTLDALYAAIVDNPADRTVRLVLADALDESGDPADATRAEFIRAQIDLEGMFDDDRRRPALASRCEGLFAANWIEWWRPVCVALGLPEPYVPSKRLGARLKRLVGSDKRVPGEPYIANPAAYSVRSDEHEFTAQFYAGFPEMLAIHRFTIDTLTGQFGQWLSLAPFCRLRFTDVLSEFEWNSLDGPHLAKVTELVLDRLPEDVANFLIRTPLTGLTSLKVMPLGLPSIVRGLVHKPMWAGLRSLTFSGISTPDSLCELAESCTLEHLEELTFGVHEVEESQPIGGLWSVLSSAIAGILAQMAHLYPRPVGPIRGPDYWPAFIALSRSPVLPRLRRLRVLDADPNWVTRVADMLANAGERAESPEPFLSDECVRAVAAALDPDKLERLELPAARISPACRDELTRRFGPRVVLA